MWGKTRMVELLSASGGRIPTKSMPKCFPRTDGDTQRVVVLTVRIEPENNFTPTNLSFTLEQAYRLRETLDEILRKDPLLVER